MTSPHCPDIDIGPLFNEKLDDCGVAFTCSENQSSGTLDIPELQLRVVLHEELGHFCVTFLAGPR